jgi:hypothetical protein
VELEQQPLSPTTVQHDHHHDNHGDHNTFYLIQNPLTFPTQHAVCTSDSLHVYSASIIFNIALAYDIKGQATHDVKSLRKAQSLYNQVIKCQCRNDGASINVVAASCLLGVIASNNSAYINRCLGSNEAVLDCVFHLDRMLNHSGAVSLLLPVLGTETISELQLNVFCADASAICGSGAPAA